MNRDGSEVPEFRGSEVLEPERYELFERPRYRFEVDRRDFLKIFSAMGGGLLVVAHAPDALAQESGRAAQGRTGAGDLASWIHVDERGHVTVFTGKVEIGQNIRTSLAQVVAEEIGAPIASVSLVMADTDLTPFDQGTFGSRTTPTMAPVLARAAATAREMLIDRAAAAWKVERAGLHAKNGAIVAADDPSTSLRTSRSIGFGDLVRGQQLAGAVPANAPVAPASAWTLRGTPVKKVDDRQFVPGRHEYTPDVARIPIGYRALRVIIFQIISPVSGTACNLAPTAANTALPTAGATGRIPPSPMPLAP